MPLLLRQRLLLLVLLVAASHGDPSGDNYNASMCLPQSYTCGGVNISYPFYLANDTRVINRYSNSYCGYPGLGILCEDGKPTLQLNGTDKYSVKGINNGSVSLANSEVVDDDGSCPRVDHNVTLPPGSWLDFPDSTVDYLVFFLGCTFTSYLIQPPSIGWITCENIYTGPGLSFVLPKPDVPPGNWSQACKQVIEVPVLKYDWPLINPNSPAWRSGGYGKFLRQGFQLAWNQTPGPCNRCERSSGRCAYNQTGEFMGCLCPNGGVKARDCSYIMIYRKVEALYFVNKCIFHLLMCTYVQNFAEDEKKRRKIYIIASTSGILLLCLLFFAFLMGSKKCRSKKRSKETPRIESFLQKNGTLHPKRYTYAQVKRMTNSFAEKLGQGGFGVVYRGDLSDGHQIAVKMLKDSKADGEEFINEVASISKTSHVNVVTLLGFCLEGSKRALIYDYMPNGSLERYAFNENCNGENTLSWEKLFDIAVGIARGLEYLHRGCNTRIVHFDIKPHNILLDQDFCPKISDFGLAKLCLNKESAISIGCARGTIGYIAPEVYSKQFGAVSSKSDVYSYGMMVLEMVGARDKNTNANSESSSQYFPQWIYEHLDEYCVSASEINGEITEIVRKMIVVGLWCIQVIPTNRPTMTTVVEMLEGSTSGLELPPKVLLT